MANFDDPLALDGIWGGAGKVEHQSRKNSDMEVIALRKTPFLSLQWQLCHLNYEDQDHHGNYCTLEPTRVTRI